MSQWEKLLERLNNLSSDLRFEELKRILEHYEYKMYSPKGGSSHFTFRKKGQGIITIPKHKPIKRVYIKLIRDVVQKLSLIHI